MNETVTKSDLRDAVNKIASSDAKIASQGVAIAAGIESESIAFYAKQAENFKGTETEYFFKFLEKQERGHLDAINELRSKLEKEGIWIEPTLPEKDGPKIFSKKDWDKEHKDGLTAVLFALWKEKRAQEFYEEVSEKSESTGMKHFFKRLAEFEKNHAALLAEFVEESYYSNELIMG